MSLCLIKSIETPLTTFDEDNCVFMSITNVREQGAVAEFVQSETAPHVTLRANNYADVFSLVKAWLYSLNSLNDQITLLIYADCDAVSAKDMLFMVHMILPDARLENSQGEQIDGFMIKSEPVQKWIALTNILKLSGQV